MERIVLDSRACANCGLSPQLLQIPLKECSRCRLVAYCSKKCQVKHWRTGGHKNFCERSDGYASVSPSHFFKSDNKPKKDIAASNMNECDNCGTKGTDLCLCSRCRVVKYCSKDCQLQHWRKGGHKQFCVALGERRPEAVAAETSKQNTRPSTEDAQCTICFDSIQSSSIAITLSCSHKFHAACVDSLRKFGVSKVCPVCRGELEGLEERVSKGLQRFAAVYLQVEQSQQSWQVLPPSQQQEIDQIIAIWQDAAKQEYPDAQYNLGITYSHGFGVEKSDTEAVQWHRLAAEQGHAQAQYNLGVMYHEGHGVGKNYKEAARWVQRAAEQGHTKAQHVVGLTYRDGQGVAQDAKEAARWFQLASEQGHSGAQFELGSMYDEGHGVKKNYKEALRYYRLAAEQGIAEAQYNLGVMYHEGHGVGKNDKEAAWYYRLAAEQGLAGAQYNLGHMYHEGHGVKKNYKEAARWKRLAAVQGNAQALCSLGHMYHEGHGVKKNDKEAARWTRRAAVQGHAQAQYSLCVIYHEGYGVEKNYKEAARWCRLAAEQGHAKAKSLLTSKPWME